MAPFQPGEQNLFFKATLNLITLISYIFHSYVRLGRYINGFS